MEKDMLGGMLYDAGKTYGQNAGMGDDCSISSHGLFGDFGNSSVFDGWQQPD